eukprot:6191794-Pleurochrysis_carterae.AAC.1
MASSDRNPIRRHIAWHLRQAQRNRDIAMFGKPGGAEWCPAKNGSVEKRAGCGYISFQETGGEEGTHPMKVLELTNAMRRSVFCLTPVGDGDGFTQRFWFSISAGCIPVRIDSYYPDFDFEGVAWPFKTTIDWRRAVVIISPKQLRRSGLLPILRQFSTEMVEEMQRYIATIVKPATRIDFEGDGPDMFSAFLAELLYLSKYRLPQLDNATSVTNIEFGENATSLSSRFAYSFSAHKPAAESSRRAGKNSLRIPKQIALRVSISSGYGDFQLKPLSLSAQSIAPARGWSLALGRSSRIVRQCRKLCAQHLSEVAKKDFNKFSRCFPFRA